MIDQQGYIKLVLVAFALIIGLLIFPVKFPVPTPESGCVVGQAPEGYEEIKDLPAISGLNDPFEDTSGGGVDPGTSTDYVLIRKKVPADSYAMSHIRPVNVATQLRVPGQPKPGYILSYPSGDGGKTVTGLDLRIKTEGLIFFVNEDPATIKNVRLPNRRPTLSRGSIIEDTVHEVDVYQDKRRYEDDNRGYKREELFQCGEEAALNSMTIIVPPQEKSQNRDQLQLEWFLMQRDGVWGVHCKPAVYLYPEKKQLVNVKVYPKGELSYTDPLYDVDNGWNVTAFPSGKIEVQSSKFKVQNYDYLYYESKILDSEIKKPEVGWSVKYEEMEQFLDKVLPKLGLNEKEAQDFKEYWLSKLPRSNYYFVGLIDKNQRDYLEALSVTPKPQTSIRFSLFFEMKDGPVQVLEPVIQTPKREGFTLVDWGGMMKLHPGTPFTCSQ